MDLVAFLEAVEPVGQRHVYLRFEAMPAALFADLRDRVPNAHVGEGPSLESSVIDLVAPSDEIKRWFGDEAIVEDEWFALRLDREGLPARQYVGPFGEQPTENVVAIASSRRLPVPEAAALAHWFQAPPQPDAITRLEAWRERTLATRVPGWPRFVLVLDVGQGNCNAVLEMPYLPRLYFDFGGGCYWNKRTYPKAREFRFDPNCLIVLSHWDADHWYSAQLVPAARDVIWLAPRQPKGPRATDFATVLERRNKLIWWPNDLDEFSLGLGHVTKCRGTGRNDSGLAMQVTLRGVGRDRSKFGRRVLLPADASYGSIPRRDSGGYSGLVAAHHGGHAVGAIPRVNRHGVVVYSFGLDNTYGHPRWDTFVKHLDAGWNRAYATLGGDVVLQPPGHAAADKLGLGMIMDWDPLPPDSGPGSSVWHRLRAARRTVPA
jgi:hypothetical protein